jgi:hypothetical protein
LAERAAWAASNCVERRPALLERQFGKVLRLFEDSSRTDGVRRNAARMLQYAAIPSRYRSRVFEACYAVIDNPNEAVAIRAFAIAVAADVAKERPELFEELRLVAAKHLPGAKAGFRSRARRVLGLSSVEQ